MKERFLEIFEFWNQRNIGFYKECFKKLETENKTSFNYIAGMFPVMWLVFRKMYGWAILITLILAGVNAVQAALIQPTGTMSDVISVVLFIIKFAIFGFVGNTLYLKHVKSKVTKGYAEISDYNPVDPVWSLLYSALGSLLKMLSIPFFVVASVSGEAIQNLSYLFASFIIAIVWAVDYRKFHPQESAEPIAVTEESVNRYLEKSDLKQMISAICVLVLISVLHIASVSSLKTLGKKVLNQLDAMPGKKDIESRIDDETRKQLDEIDKLNKRILEKKKSGRVDESLKKDQEALAARWAELAKYAKKKNSQKVPKKTVNHPR